MEWTLGLLAFLGWMWWRTERRKAMAALRWPTIHEERGEWADHKQVIVDLVEMLCAFVVSSGPPSCQATDVFHLRRLPTGSWEIQWEDRSWERKLKRLEESVSRDLGPMFEESLAHHHEARWQWHGLETAWVSKLEVAYQQFVMRYRETQLGLSPIQFWLKLDHHDEWERKVASPDQLPTIVTRQELDEQEDPQQHARRVLPGRRGEQ